eukprot:4770054-Heterocapsa_arctica.AAC.1
MISVPARRPFASSTACFAMLFGTFANPWPHGRSGEDAPTLGALDMAAMPSASPRGRGCMAVSLARTRPGPARGQGRAEAADEHVLEPADAWDLGQGSNAARHSREPPAAGPQAR